MVKNCGKFRLFSVFCLRASSLPNHHPLAPHSRINTQQYCCCASNSKKLTYAEWSRKKKKRRNSGGGGGDDTRKKLTQETKKSFVLCGCARFLEPNLWAKEKQKQKINWKFISHETCKSQEGSKHDVTHTFRTYSLTCPYIYNIWHITDATGQQASELGWWVAIAQEQWKLRIKA